MASILIVEDEHALGSALSLAVRRMGHLPTLAPSGAAALERLQRQAVDVLVLDIGLPDVSGLEVLRAIRGQGSKVPVVIITAHATLDHAIASQKLGIADYLVKPLDLRRFEESISNLVARGGMLMEPANHQAITLIGAAPRMHEVFLGVARACAGDLPVLIHGPCGSGKSLAARVIHSNGARALEPLRVFEGGGIRSREAFHTLLADSSGTLLIEDLSGLDLELQGMLAEHIATPAVISPRLIATFQHAPQAAVTDGTLRADLFYALSALTLEMPPLRERAGDIPALSRFFAGMKGQTSGPVEITAAALCAMQAYAWPGNVRELRHTLEHALAVSRGGPIFPGHLPPHLTADLPRAGGIALSGELETVISRWLDSQLDLTPQDLWRYDSLLEQVESSILRHLLKRFNERPTHLAAALRMHRATLRQKLRRAGLGAADGPADAHDC
jgi:DNA-binding NtrC family response regulator